MAGTLQQIASLHHYNICNSQAFAKMRLRFRMYYLLNKLDFYFLLSSVIPKYFFHFYSEQDVKIVDFPARWVV